ncbi:MAG: nucleotide sugar dehydrogenase [Salinigranum sp.]
MTRVVVHGLGYIGLPTAAVIADSGLDVAGYDTSDGLRKRLREGTLSFEEPGLDALVDRTRREGALTFVSDVPTGDYHLVCVPTPMVPEENRADVGYVEAAGRNVAAVLREGDTVVLESTVPPGTTTGALRETLESTGLRAGEEFSLAHCPETVLPGNLLEEIRSNDRLLAGVDERSTRKARELYGRFTDGDIATRTDPTTVEFVKLAQNTYRDVNVALANELAKVAHDYGVDSREAIALANRHPRVEVHQPGPGVGGHCLPIDPWFLGQESDRLDLIERAREVNDAMPSYVSDVLGEELGSLESTKIAILGVAYKGNVEDTRRSPGLELAMELGPRRRSDDLLADGGRGPEVTLYDPHVTDIGVNVASYEDAIRGADAAVVTTDHDEFTELDPAETKRLMAGDLVVDTKAVLDREAWSTAGFAVRRI